MKKCYLTVLTLGIILSIAGCGAKSSDSVENVAVEETTTTNEATTLGNQLANLFYDEIATSTDLEAIANDLAAVTDMNCVVVPVSEGYLNGFSEEVSGFTSGVQFSPMIGSIPFVGYIFEAEDAEGLKDKLLQIADPRWNICTEAAETVCVTSGNYVFFTMCPGDKQ